MSQCLYMHPNPHTFPMSMPFTHIDSANSPRTSNKRKLPFPEEPRRSPPVGPEQRLPQDSSSAIPRLNPNPYSASQMATLPPAQQISLPSRSLYGRDQESLPSLRELIPDFNSYNIAPSPTASARSRQFGGGPETFQPSGPTTRPAASGLAPSPVAASRQSTYTTPDSTPNVRSFQQQDRQYAQSAPATSRSSTTRNSPTQPLSHTPDSLRALPPLGAAFGPSEPSRTGSFGPYPASSLPHPSAPYSGPMAASLPLSHHFPSAGSSGQYGSPHTALSQNPASAGYTHFDNNDYNSDGKSRRRRGNLPKAVTDTLRKWFNEHIAHPYPTEDEKMMLMSTTGLTMSQISNWFINARRRSVPPTSRENIPSADMYPTDRGA